MYETFYINAICYSEKSNVGFVYEPSHEAFPDKENIDFSDIEKVILEIQETDDEHGVFWVSTYNR